MLDKTKNNINEKHFNFVLGILTTLVIGYLLFIGNIDKNSVIGMIAAMGFNIITFLGISFGLQHYQLGTGRDIQKEIYDESNIAASIYQAGIWIGLAIVISKGLF